MSNRPGKTQRQIRTLTREIEQFSLRADLTSDDHARLDAAARRRSQLLVTSWVSRNGGTKAHWYRNSLYDFHFLCFRCKWQQNYALTFAQYKRSTIDVHPGRPAIGMRHIYDECNGAIVLTHWRYITCGSRRKVLQVAEGLRTLHHQVEGVPGHRCEWCRPELSTWWRSTWWSGNLPQP
jgi:hypothetical protein